MTQNLRAFATAAGVLAATLGAEPAWAQKSGGILKMYDPDSPASMSILEEGTVFAEGPMMGVFNNVADPHRPPLRDQRRAGVHVGRNPWGSGAFP
jgi:hypothetical protein